MDPDRSHRPRASGANSIRLYTFKTSQRHQYFLHSADRAGLVVIGAFEIGTAEHTPLASRGWSPLDGIDANAAVQKVKARLARQLRFSRHPVMVMWFVGNEINGAWQGFVCEDDYASQHLEFTDHCQFGTAAKVLMRIVDSLCETVRTAELRRSNRALASPHSAPTLPSDAIRSNQKQSEAPSPLPTAPLPFCSSESAVLTTAAPCGALACQVHEEGLLCSTPLAGVNLPGAFTDNGYEYSVQGWIQAMDPIMVSLTPSPTAARVNDCRDQLLGG